MSGMCASGFQFSWLLALAVVDPQHVSVLIDNDHSIANVRVNAILARNSLQIVWTGWISAYSMKLVNMESHAETHGLYNLATTD